MDKEFLFQYMRSRFREAGFTEEETELHISRFSKRYANAGDDQIEADLQKHGGASRVIEHIIKQRNSYLESNPQYQALVSQAVIRANPQTAENPVQNSAADAASGNDQPRKSTPVPDDEDRDVNTYVPKAKTTQPSKESSDTLSGGAEKTMSAEESRNLSGEELLAWFQQNNGITAPPAAEPRPAQPAKPVPHPQQNASVSQEDMSRTRVIHVPQKEQGSQSSASVRKTNAAPERVSDTQRGSDARRANAPRQTPDKTTKNHGKTAKQPWYSRLPEITYWGEGTEEGYRRFWIIFGVSLPFAAVPLLAFAALSIGIIAAIVGGIIGLILLLVGEVAAGAALSLVGIIYGISQLFLTLPVGLFELGIGICTVGATMLAGILIYNLAVRFLPFLLKQFIRFLKFMKGLLIDLYYYVKGECYRR